MCNAEINPTHLYLMQFDSLQMIRGRTNYCYSLLYSCYRYVLHCIFLYLHYRFLHYPMYQSVLTKNSLS